MDFILTNDGAAVMTEAASGKDLVLTRAESGTGYSSAPATMSAVSGKQQDLDIEEVAFENQETRITVFLSNRLLETGYNLRQIGIYGKIAGSDQDVLMIVGQQYSGEPIHPISDGEEECRYNVLMKVSGTSSITVEGGSGSLATKRELLNHTENKKNPHNVSAEQVGLGNVPNVKTDDQTPTVEMASDRANIEKGDTFKTIVGKMMKWFADLKTGAFSSVANNLLTTLAGSVLDARQGKVLKENIDAVDTKVTEIYSDLPKIQCGSGSIVKGTVITDITFKKSFSSVPTVIVAPKDLKSDELESDVRRGTFTANSVTMNGFQCYIDRNANTYDLPFYWIAME